MVIHGYPYSGPYPETTWPGFTTFQYAYTEMWGPRQPAWDFLNDTLMYCARNSLVLQTGTPQTDLAFYLYNDPWRPTDNYFGEELNAAGGCGMFLVYSSCCPDPVSNALVAT